MYNNVSGCYYHPNKLSVAVCSECGHGLCRDCIVKGRSGKTLCIDCANRELKQDHKEYQRLLRENGGRFRTGREFLLPGIIGIVLCVAVTFLMISDGHFFSSSDNPVGSIPAILFSEYNIFAVPFCVRGLMDRFAPRYTTSPPILRPIIYLTVPLFASWLFLSFYLVRFFTIPKQK